jgi:hypothetical protein
MGWVFFKGYKIQGVPMEVDFKRIIIGIIMMLGILLLGLYIL